MGIPLAVLIVEDSEDDAFFITRLLTKAGYEVVSERIETAAEMRVALEKRAWDIVISDYSLPQFNGRAALELLQETGVDIPFIVASGAIGEETAVALMKAGAHDYVMKDNLARLAPAVERELNQVKVRWNQKRAEEQLRQLSRAVEHSPVSIIITDVNGQIEYVNPKFTALTGYELEDVQGYTPRILKSGKTPIEVYQGLWQTILAGEEWRGELLNRKKNGTLFWEYISISAIADEKGHISHFVAVKDDITARKDAEEKIQLLNAELEKLAMSDYLTNLYNRRFFMQRGEEEFKRAKRSQHPFSVLMLDIDKFKSVNDTYGHETGDLVLKQIAVTLKYNLREIDILGRVGGEEFAALLPDTSLQDARISAERVRQAVQNETLLAPGAALSVTISVGAAAFAPDMLKIDDVLRNADSALYEAKHSGSNCVRLYENIATEPPGSPGIDW
jgi:diguanylate cyclase (GGDEF)-like protein/PAS domain S-box-containing protein